MPRCAIAIIKHAALESFFSFPSDRLSSSLFIFLLRVKQKKNMERGDVCSHDHDCGGEDCGGSSLHGYINHPRVSVLNAEDDAAAPRVLRPWYGIFFSFFSSRRGADHYDLIYFYFLAPHKQGRKAHARGGAPDERRRPGAHPAHPLHERCQGERNILFSTHPTSPPCCLF